MTRAEVVHSTQAVKVIFKGDPRRPEPPIGIIEFPGGHVEVARCTDGTYWAHIEVVDGVNIVDGRIDRASSTGQVEQSVTDLPDHEHVKHIAIRVTNAVPHPNLE